MKVKILYLASLREQLGRSGEDVEISPATSTVAGLRMLLISRCLERIGDHAVDIGEQTAYLVTGEFREFTDASHPERLET